MGGLNMNALAAGLGAAAPGVAAAGQNYQADQQAATAALPRQAQQGANAAVGDLNNSLGVNAMSPDALDAGITGATNTSAAQQTGGHPMADASHPFWRALGSIVGSGGAMQQGGIVTPNYQRPTVQPEFTKGPATPTGSANATAIPSFTQAPPSAYQNGGVVGYEAGGTVNSARQQAIQVGVGRDQTGVESRVIPASTEGQVLTMAEGGSVPNTYQPGGAAINVPMTGPAAGLVQGFQAGMNIGNNLHEAFRRNKSISAEQDFAGQATSADAENPDLANSQNGGQPSMVDRAKDAVEGFFHHLHGGTLNDQHVSHDDAAAQAAIPTGGQSPAGAPAGQPSTAIPPPAAGAAQPAPVQPNAAGSVGAGQPGSPPPQAGAPPTAPAAGSSPASPQQAVAAGTQKAATVAAVKDAAADPAAQQGIPQDSPAESGKPHSLTPEYWRNLEQKKVAAVKAMIGTGMDPAQAYQSLTALQTSHFQGQILKQLSAANVALQNGDEKSVKQALSNVNYYLPNGQGMTFRKASASDAAADTTGNTKVGQLMYRNPMYGLYGHQGEPEYTSVTPQHLQLIGAAALDPRTVQETMLKTYSAQAQAQKEMLQAQGEFMTGQGRQAWGNAAATNAQLAQQMAPVKQFLTKMTGLKNAAEAGWYERRTSGPGASGQPKVTMASIQSAQKAALAAVDANSQGNLTSVPAQEPSLDANGQPVMGPDGKPQMRPSLSPAAGRSIHDPGKIPTLYQNMTPDQIAATRGFAGTFAASNPGLSPQDAADLGARVARAGTAKNPSVHMNPQTKQVEKDVAPDPKNNSIHIWVGNGYRTIWVQPNVLSADSQGIPTDEGQPSDSGDESSNPDDYKPAEDSQNMSN